MIAPPSARLLSLSNVENGISVGTRLRTYPEGENLLLRIKFSRWIRRPGGRGDRRF
jgi:hypothetical protein